MNVISPFSLEPLKCSMAVLNVPGIRSAAIDLVISDVITACGGMAAELMGLPWVELTPHPLYWQLGNTPFAREQAYVDLVRAGLAPEQHAALGQAAHSGWALGGDDFIADLEKRTARRASRAARGRPVKAEETASN